MLSTNQILLISQIPGVGISTLKTFVDYALQKKLKLTERASEIVEIFQEIKKDKPRVKIPSTGEISVTMEKVNTIIDQSVTNGIKTISFIDKDYPHLFKLINNPPLILHYKGNIACLEKPTVAIIGTREPSEHAQKMGPRLTQYFVDAGFTIVSGLALGSDTLAHKAAVLQKKSTVAVLAGGLHSIYPKENLTLSLEILENNGLLISELAFGMNPYKSTFVERDRLQSGLSIGIVVIETGTKGGTLHTVGFAHEQKRKIACMYSQSSTQFDNHNKFEGNKKLVSEGKAIKLHNQQAIYSYIDVLLDSYFMIKKDRKISMAEETNNLEENQSDKKVDGQDQLSLFQ